MSSFWISFLLQAAAATLVIRYATRAAVDDVATWLTSVICAVIGPIVALLVIPIALREIIPFLVSAPALGPVFPLLIYAAFTAVYAVPIQLIIRTEDGRKRLEYGEAFRVAVFAVIASALLGYVVNFIRPLLF